MAVNIGPKIGIDGEAQFRKELSNIIQQAKTLESEMKAVTSQFDANDNSQEKLSAQSEILTKQLELQQKRVEMLEKGVKAATDQFGDADSRTQKWKQALYEAQTQMNNSKKSADNLEDGVDDAGQAMQDAKDDAFSFGDALKANLTAGAIIEGVKSIAGAIDGIAEETAEYRKIMASLETSSQDAGYTAEETAQSYEKLFGVLGDDQSSATTVANLQAVGLEQEKLTQITDGAIGAWAKYGDSIPIDGLAEGINETIRCGTVTGTFADVLNWAAEEGETFGVKLKDNVKFTELTDEELSQLTDTQKAQYEATKKQYEETEEWNQSVEDATTAEDYFNLALQDCSDSTERANKVLELFEKKGLTKVGKAWQENNEDLIDANKSTLDYKDNMAELAERLTPVTSSIQDGINGIFEKSLQLTENVDFSGVGDAIEGGFSYLIDNVVPAVFDFVNFIIENKEIVIGAITGVGAALAGMKAAEIITDIFNAIKANPIGIALSAVALLVGALEGYISSLENVGEAEKIHNELLEETRAKNDEARESYLQVTEAAEEKATKDLAEIQNVQNLYGQLQNLVDANGKVKDANKARVDFILGELNEALGTEYQLTDNQIQKYSEMKQSVMDLIEARKLEILMEQAETGYEEALTNKAAADAAYAENYRAVQEQKEQYGKVYDEWLDLMAEKEAARAAGYETIWQQENITRATELDARVRKEKEALDQEQAQLDQSKADKERYYQAITRYEDAQVLASEGNTREAVELLSQQNDAFKTAKSVAGKSAKEQKEELQDQYAQALLNLEQYAREYKKGTEGYTKETLDLYKEHAEDAKTEMEKVGGAVVDGTTTGINGREWKLQDTIDSLFDLVPQWAKDVLGIKSPSRVFREIGEYSGEGYELGFIERIKSANRKIENAITKGIDAVSGTVSAGIDFSVGDTAYSNAMMQLQAQQEYGAAVMEFAAQKSPAASQMSNSRSINYNGGINISVQAAPGMDINALVSEIERRLATATARREAVW